MAASLREEPGARAEGPGRSCGRIDPMKIDRGCHCGKIRYAAEVDPGKVVICHCTDCQTLSGSAFRTGAEQRRQFQAAFRHPQGLRQDRGERPGGCKTSY